MAHTRRANVAAGQSWTTAQLVHALRAYGISYLNASQYADDAQPADGQADRPPIPRLLRALARAEEPRVRDTLIGLLLLHPKIASDVVDLIEQARRQDEQFLAEQVITLSLAAMYLQRIWRFQLALAYDTLPQLDEALFGPWRLARKLPPPASNFGESGLRRLAEYERERTGTAANYAGDWQNQVNHLIAQEWSRTRHEHPVDRRELSRLWQFLGQMSKAARDESEREMSFRPDVARDDIERFLEQFGQLSQQTGRLYLVGGAELVHSGLRGVGATTVDIDLRMEVGDETAAETLLRQLMSQLGVNVELASPADFMPLPADWQARSPFVGRYGTTDVFYFDYYALALSKISRGTSRDLSDLAILAQNGLIQRDDLEAAYQQILPQLGHGRFFNIDPAKFAQQYAAALSLLPETN